MSDTAARRFDRRTLLVRGGVVAGASAIAGAGAYAAARGLAEGNGAADTSAGASRLENGLFLLDSRYANLTTFLLATHPRGVREAIERHRRALDANAALYLRESEASLEEAARSAAAAYLGAEPDEVALTDSTTMGLGLVYARLRLEAGDEVVTTEHDFYATHESLRLRQEVDDVTVRRVRLYDEPESASVEEIVGEVSRALGPRTRCLALTWVHSSTGVKLPLREIAEAVARANGGRPRTNASSSASTASTGSASRTLRPWTSASTSSSPGATNGSSARAGPGSSGRRRRHGSAWRRRSPPSTGGLMSLGSRVGRRRIRLRGRS